jgi:hypothetical protein
MAARATVWECSRVSTENEVFSSYLERIEFFFEANSVQDNKKVAVFLTVQGSNTHSLLRSLVAPAVPKDKSFAEIVAVLRKHFQPKPLVIAEHFHFHQHSQNVGES